MGFFYFMYPKIIKSIIRLMPFQFIYINVDVNWSFLDFLVMTLMILGLIFTL